MAVEVVPPLPEAEQQALGHALAQARLPLDGLPEGYRSAWRRAALRESADNEPAPARYALSPRSTRGATRA